MKLARDMFSNFVATGLVQFCGIEAMHNLERGFLVFLLIASFGTVVAG